MKKIVIIILLSLVSCKSYKEIKDHELIIPKTKSLGEFHTLSNGKKDKDYQVSIQGLFNIRNLDSVVKVAINKNNELEIHYKNVLGGHEVEVFKGKFKKNYFEVYLDKKRIFFPPIYCKNNINRLRIALTQNNDLVINRHYDRSGMFLLFAAGSSGNKQYVFKSK